MILIDPPNAPGHGRLWSHLASDASYDELHVFARAIGIPERELAFLTRTSILVGIDQADDDVPAESVVIQKATVRPAEA